MIPVISKLMGKAKKLAAPRPNTLDPSYNSRLHMVKAEPLVVVVVPTRELAMQTFDEARRMCYRSAHKSCEQTVIVANEADDTNPDLCSGHASCTAACQCKSLVRSSERAAMCWSRLPAVYVTSWTSHTS